MSGQPPIIALVGLTTAGKTTVSQLLEARSLARRLIMLTTRPPRLDDPTGWFDYVTEIVPRTGDIVFEGWGQSRYCVRGESIRRLRELGNWPILDLGDVEPALWVKERYHPTVIVMVAREVTAERVQTVCKARGMARNAIEERVRGLEADRHDLAAHVWAVDFVLENSGSVEETMRNIDALVQMISQSMAESDEVGRTRA